LVVALAVPLVAIPLAISVNEITAVRVGVIAIVVAIIRIGVRTGAIIAGIAARIGSRTRLTSPQRRKLRKV
jgi:hypothetical protein